MEFGIEIGKTLDGMLRLFKSVKELCADDLIHNYRINEERSREIIFALFRRGYIINSYKPYSKNFESANDIDIAEMFRITIEGCDYLELHKAFWQRFWFRSIGCPIIVSFITAINAKPIWNLIVGVVSSLYDALNK